MTLEEPYQDAISCRAVQCPKCGCHWIFLEPGTLVCNDCVLESETTEEKK